jgi:hypothetical protein
MYKILGGDGREYGPVSADVLRQWIAEGRANAQTRVMLEGATEWKLLGGLPEFMGTLGTTTTPGNIPATIVAPPTAPRNNPLAVAGLILGILALTLGFCCYGLPFNIAALILSIIGLVQINKEPQRYSGKGMAIAGLILAILSFALGALLLILGLALSSSDWLRKLQNM